MEEKEIRDIVGNVIDFTEDLIERVSFETASPLRRFLAYLVDLLFVVVIWYLATRHLFKEIELFVESIGLNESDFTDLELFLQFRDLLWQLYLKIFLYWIFIKTAYFSLAPALIGRGQTVGKMFAGIGAVNRSNLEEASASRLIFREFVGRGLLETMLILPHIVSMFLVLFRKDSRSLHDLLAGTVVIKFDLHNEQ